MKPIEWAIAHWASYDPGMTWTRPSARTCELMRAGVELFMSDPVVAFEGLVAQIDLATLTGQDAAVADDPAVAADLHSSNYANLLFWAESIRRDPGARVLPNPGPEPRIIARSLIRRGLNESALHAWRVGENAAWRIWMNVVFTLTSDPGELAELLDYSARSIFDYVDATIALVSSEMRFERQNLRLDVQAERLETVTLLIEGAPIDTALATKRLAYSLDRSHLAAIIWDTSVDPDVSALLSAGDALSAATASARPLMIPAAPNTMWLWLPAHDLPPDEALNGTVAQCSSLRMAVGSPEAGVAGFRRSHLQAQRTQRLLQRGGRRQVAAWQRTRLIEMLTQDEAEAEEFVRRTLGQLADADPVLRQTLGIYLRRQSNAPKAAAELFTHRNTVLGRVARAEQLLPAPLASNAIDVAAALELDTWIN